MNNSIQEIIDNYKDRWLIKMCDQINSYGPAAFATDLHNCGNISDSTKYYILYHFTRLK